MTQEELNEDLIRACRYGKYDVAEYLIEKGANVNTKDNDGYTPIHNAACWGYTEIVKLLIKAGANVNAKDRYGRTPLHRAAGKGYAEVEKLLIKAGAILNEKDNDGDTPLHEAVWFGHIEIVKLLVEAGADVDAKNKYGSTPLNYAARWGYTEIVKLLEQAVDTRIMIMNQVMNQQAVKWKTLSEIGLSLSDSASEDIKAMNQDLRYACSAGYLNKAKELIEKINDGINTIIDECPPESIFIKKSMSYMCKEIKNMSSLLKKMDDKINKFLGR